MAVAIDMSTSKPMTAKIIHHSEGMGTPSEETVRQRAIELARINGHETFTDLDWASAERELHGGHTSNSHHEPLEMTGIVSERDMILGDIGHRIEVVRLDDDDNLVEELFVEGMDEAVHEQMLAAALVARHEDAEAEKAEG